MTRKHAMTGAAMALVMIMGGGANAAAITPPSEAFAQNPGSDYFLGRGKRMPRFRAPIRLHVGRTFTLTLDPALSHRAAMKAASDELMRRIAELIDERHRGRFQSGPV